VKEIELIEKDSEMMVSHIEIANMTGVKPQNVLNIIDKYIDELEKVGTIFFKKTVSGNNISKRECFLNESSSSLLMTFSKNTTEVVKFKVKLITAFKELRELADNSEKAKNIELRSIVLKLEGENSKFHSMFERQNTINEILKGELELASTNIVKLADAINTNAKISNENVGNIKNMKRKSK